MSVYTEINIKEGMPPVYEAMEYLKGSLCRCRSNKYKCGFFYRENIFCAHNAATIRVKVHKQMLRRCMPSFI